MVARLEFASVVITDDLWYVIDSPTNCVLHSAAAVITICLRKTTFLSISVTLIDS